MDNTEPTLEEKKEYLKQKYSDDDWYERLIVDRRERKTDLSNNFLERFYG
jgi:hypothetical protein